MSAVEEIGIVIVGGGICGLATALALHRKGIKSVVLERSDTLRATGAAIGVFPNGWRALHQLGFDSSLRSTAIPFQRAVDVWADKGVERETLLSEGEARCLRRNDLVEALANALPSETIRFGCQVVSMNAERSSSYTLLQLHDGSLIKAKLSIMHLSAQKAMEALDGYLKERRQRVALLSTRTYLTGLVLVEDPFFC